MNRDKNFLAEQIAAEHSKAQTMRIVRWVGHDAERLALLMDIFLGDDYRLTQRSAWAVRYVAENAPELMAPWLQVMVEQLYREGIHDAVKRNVLNVFAAIPVHETLRDTLADLCFGYLADLQEAVAIRCESMTILSNLCREIPELKQELRLLIEEHAEHGTAGFKSRSRKILKKIG